MPGEIGDVGYLKIESADDRATIAAILFKHGYTISTVRRKRNGKAYEYYVKYELRSREWKESE